MGYQLRRIQRGPDESRDRGSYLVFAGTVSELHHHRGHLAVPKGGLNLQSAALDYDVDVMGQGYMFVGLLVYTATAVFALCLPPRFLGVVRAVVFHVVLGVPSIGGLVMVGMMMKSYGICTTLPNGHPSLLEN